MYALTLTDLASTPSHPVAAQGWEGNAGALAPFLLVVHSRPGARVELPTMGKGHHRDPDSFPSPLAHCPSN